MIGARAAAAASGAFLLVMDVLAYPGMKRAGFVVLLSIALLIMCSPPLFVVAVLSLALARRHHSLLVNQAFGNQSVARGDR